MTTVYVEQDQGAVLNIYDPAAPDIPPEAVEMDVDPALLLRATSPADLVVSGDTLQLDPARVAARKAADLRPAVKRRMRRLLKDKIKAATGIEDDDELMLAITLAPQAIKDRIQRVRSRLQAKDAELEQLDRAALEAFDPETEIDWS